MKTIILSIILLVLFSSSTCKKEGADCHRKIIIKNNSDTAIIQAFKFYYNDKCLLSGNRIEPDSLFIDNRSQCWEDMFYEGKQYELFIVNPNNYNTQLVFYNCDSIIFKNTILKHYKLTLSELKQSNFTITYP